MEWIKVLFGEGKDLDILQMSCRAVVAFLITLLLIRIAGIRTVGKKPAKEAGRSVLSKRNKL